MTSAETPSVPGPTIEPISILLVDDDASILETLVDIFEDMGFRAQTAATGTLALARLQQHSYHLALLDIGLPDMAGTELLAHARRLQPDMKCIMATASNTLQYAVDSINEGAYAYLLKPVDVLNVQETVRRALYQQRLELQNRLLLDITDAALSSLELEELLPRVLGRFLDYYRADGGVVFTTDVVSGRLFPRATLGITARISAEPVSQGEGLAGRAGKEGRVLGATNGELAFDPISGRGVEAALAAPLRSGERLIGALRLDWGSRRVFTAEEESLLLLLSERAAIQIDHARRYDEERHLAHRLAERIDLEERLELISGYLMSLTTASRCVVWLISRENLACASVTGLDPRQERMLRRLELPLPEASLVVRKILESGQATVVPDLYAAGLFPAEVLSRPGSHAALLLPLRFEGRAIGLVALDQSTSARSFGERQVRQATTVAFMSAGAIQQAKIIQAERNMARTLAESFLSVTPRRKDVQLASRYEPASDVEQIGGDYYDFIELEEHLLGVVLGDVCGKGIAAAIYTGKAKDMLYAYVRENHEHAREAGTRLSPQWVLTRLNRALYSRMSEECMFITMIFGILDTREGTFTYTNAAHPAGVLYQPRGGEPDAGEIWELASTGPVIRDVGGAPAEECAIPADERPTNGMVGAFEYMEFTEHTVPLAPGAVMALFTDGVTEARRNGEMLESEGVQAVVRELAAGSAGDLADAIYSRAWDFAAGMLRDDVAIVIVKNVPGD